jgi:CheY-like chemotaxis protein
MGDPVPLGFRQGRDRDGEAHVFDDRPMIQPYSRIARPGGKVVNGRRIMAKSILSGKMILAVDDEKDVLEVLEEEILAACPDCTFDKATTYKQASERMASWTYDLVILDIMGVRGFDLLEIAVSHHVPVVMLTAHALNPDYLKHSIEMGARAYLPKDKLGEIIPFLEDVIKYEYGPGWRRLLKQLEGLFNRRWGPYWKNSDEKFWKEFEEKLREPK